MRDKINWWNKENKNGVKIYGFTVLQGTSY